MDAGATTKVMGRRGIAVAITLVLTLGSLPVTAAEAPRSTPQAIGRVSLRLLRPANPERVTADPLLGEVVVTMRGAVSAKAAERLVRDSEGHVLRVTATPAGRTTTLHLELAYPTATARIVREGRDTFLELVRPVALRETEAPAPLPVFTHAAPDPVPALADVKATPPEQRALLADAEAAAAAGDFAGAQAALDALAEDPAPAILLWGALLQAEVHARTGRDDDARLVLERLVDAASEPNLRTLATLRLAALDAPRGTPAVTDAFVAEARGLGELVRSVEAELLARQARARFLEGYFAKAIAAFRELVHLDPTHPALATLAPAMDLARWRTMQALAERGEWLAVAAAATVLQPPDVADPFQRREALLLAEAFGQLGLFRIEREVRLGLVLAPADEAEAVHHLVRVATGFVAEGRPDRAALALRFLDERHPKGTALPGRAGATSRVARAEGDTAAAATAARQAIAEGDPDRARAARLAWEAEGPAAAAALLAGADEAVPLPRGTTVLLPALRDEAEAAAGGCASLVARTPLELAALAPERILVVARCCRTLGAPDAALALLDALAADRDATTGRLAKAEAADIRWEQRNAARLVRYLGPPTPAPAPATSSAPVATDDRRVARAPKKDGPDAP